MKTVASADRLSPASSSLGAVPLLFAGSGCAALVYEIVWFQLLELYVGSSAVSIGVLLATFMGGMALGSMYLPRLIGTACIRCGSMRGSRSAWRLGPLLVAVMPVGRLISPGEAARGPAPAVRRGGRCGLFAADDRDGQRAGRGALGGTNARRIAWLGLLYAGNTAGGVAGAVLARSTCCVYDLTTAAVVACASLRRRRRGMCSRSPPAGPLPGRRAGSRRRDDETASRARRGAGPRLTAVPRPLRVRAARWRPSDLDAAAGPAVRRHGLLCDRAGGFPSVSAGGAVGSCWPGISPAARRARMVPATAGRGSPDGIFVQRYLTG